MYIHRLYSRVDVRRTNPYLVVATALYLACKIEEYPQHIRVVTNEARNLWPGKFDHQVKISRNVKLTAVKTSFVLIPHKSANANSS